jgi:hypothetical protein
VFRVFKVKPVPPDLRAYKDRGVIRENKAL